ncbi:sensor histidine kinase [Poseidonocella sedimentorum]|nr:HAMP domain-containing sensor histidine kinase [Poseidonocella sedimentorum]
MTRLIRVGAVALLGGIVAWICGLAVHERLEMRQMRRDAAVLADSFAHDLTRRLDVLSVAARGWTRDPALDLIIFQERASAMRFLISDIEGLARVDSAGKIVASIPKETFDPQTDVREISGLSEARLSAIESRGVPDIAPRIAPPAGGETQGHSWILHLPVISDRQVLGSMLIQISLDDVFHAHLESPGPRAIEERYRISATLNAKPVSAGPAVTPEGLHAVGEAALLGHALEVTLQPGREVFSLVAPALILLFAVVASVLTALCGLLWAQRRDTQDAKAQLFDALNRIASLSVALKAANLAGERSESESGQLRDEADRLLSTVSHEVRTPLNAIMGMFELIVSQAKTDNVRRKARTGLSAAQRLHRLMSNLLEHTKIRGGRLEVMRMYMPTGLLSRSWANTLEGLISHARHDVVAEVTVADDLPDRVYVDRERVEQIVVNLLDNAVKATTEGKVQVDMRRDGPKGENLVITVTDTGPGIPADFIDSIFLPFVYQEANPKAAASGLGLAISRDLARAMEGSLTAENLPEGGARFTLILRDAAGASGRDDRLRHSA